MSTAERLAGQQYAMILRRDLARLPGLYAPDAAYTIPGATLRPTELPAFLRTWTGAFPDLRAEVTGRVETAGGLALEQRLTGTHTGVLHTPLGTVAPTGRTVSWDVVDVVRARRGRIVAWRSYFDWGQFYLALGVQLSGFSRQLRNEPLAVAA
ncbi:ester cyclase [Micromonospora sp. NPDC000207]|uniref:ester cyclase n=1 Tax=Micromonospora sp. NPDC000207 TaxID=3154246 RepID=UPI0033173806